jgi:hypothetical protein
MSRFAAVFSRSLFLPALILLTGSCSQIDSSRGADLYVQQRYFESEYQLHRALEADPTNANAALLLSLVYLKTYREIQAEPILRQLAQSETEDPVDAAALPEFAGMSASAAAKQLLGQPQRNIAAVGDLEDQILREHPSEPSPAKSSDKGRTKRQKSAVSTPAASDSSHDSAGKAFGVHILSVQDERQVPKAAAKLKTKLPKLFAGKDVRSLTVDLGAKGVYHRVLLGPYSTRKEAENACAVARKSYSFCEVLPF